MPQAKAAILATPLSVHGGTNGQVSLLDLSTNSNPFGPPRDLLEHISKVDISVYPDPAVTEARQAAARYHDASLAEIAFGNGSADLIQRLVTAYVSRGERVLIAAPTFGEYARAARLEGAEVTELEVYQGKAQYDRAQGKQAHRDELNYGLPDLQGLLNAIRQQRPKLVFVCQPNNPTGHAWSKEALQALAAACRRYDALLVLDLAYAFMLSQPPLACQANVLQLYSLTKSFAIPGIRVGYAVAPRVVAEALRRSAPPWQTSSHAQAAACWALSPAGQTFLDRTVLRWLTLSKTFFNDLRQLGLRVMPSSTAYCQLIVENSSELTLHAAEAGFRLRDCSSFGQPDRVRVATRLPEENARLLAWLKENYG